MGQIVPSAINKLITPPIPAVPVRAAGNFERLKKGKCKMKIELQTDYIPIQEYLDPEEYSIKYCGERIDTLSASGHLVQKNGKIYIDLHNYDADADKILDRLKEAAVQASSACPASRYMGYAEKMFIEKLSYLRKLSSASNDPEFSEMPDVIAKRIDRAREHCGILFDHLMAAYNLVFEGLGAPSEEDKITEIRDIVQRNLAADATLTLVQSPNEKSDND
jgi:hypothetical protein